MHSIQTAKLDQIQDGRSTALVFHLPAACQPARQCSRLIMHCRARHLTCHAAMSSSSLAVDLYTRITPSSGESQVRAVRRARGRAGPRAARPWPPAPSPCPPRCPLPRRSPCRQPRTSCAAAQQIQPYSTHKYDSSPACSSTTRGARRRVTAMSLCMRVLRASTWRSVAASASSSASAASACGSRRRCAFAHGGHSFSTGHTAVVCCVLDRATLRRNRAPGPSVQVEEAQHLFTTEEVIMRVKGQDQSKGQESRQASAFCSSAAAVAASATPARRSSAARASAPARSSASADARAPAAASARCSRASCCWKPYSSTPTASRRAPASCVARK